MFNLTIKEHLEFFLKEDISYLDITTEAIVPESIYSEANFKAKEDLVVAGLPFIETLFKIIDNSISIKFFCKDGDFLNKGSIIATISGNAKTLLTVERTALNLLQRLSGIATLTNSMVNLIKDYNSKLVDTRKTTPGLRYFEKYAVKVGGAVNHRFNLSDSVLIKDNHIKIAGSVKKAVELAKKSSSFTTKIEVEVKNFNELYEAIDAKADIVLLDNMNVDKLKEAVKICKGKIITEASGNITPETVKKVAETGVDYISAGFITHHAVWKDINMKIN